MATHVMLDIETWNRSASEPLILSIGAVKFTADAIVDRFHVGVDPVDAARYGFRPDAETTLWWMDPKRDEARKELLDLVKVDLWSAVDGFLQWCGLTPLDERGSLWGKGATFDNVRLKAVSDKLGLGYADVFSYRQDECYRTLANRCPDVPFSMLGTAHSAVADAESQAVHLQAIAKHYGLSL